MVLQVPSKEGRVVKRNWGLHFVRSCFAKNVSFLTSVHPLVVSTGLVRPGWGRASASAWGPSCLPRPSAWARHLTSQRVWSWPLPVTLQPTWSDAGAVQATSAGDLLDYLVGERGMKVDFISQTSTWLETNMVSKCLFPAIWVNRRDLRCIN